jgi:histone chaperone ASF1
MAAVNVLNISVLNNPAPFNQKLSFEVTFECLTALSEDLEWKVVYVGSTDPKYDQTLDSVLVGPVPVGTSRFVLEVRQ